MEPNDKKMIATVARVMCESFLEDPMNMAQLEGLQNPETLLQKHAMMHTRHAIKTRNLCILDGSSFGPGLR